MWDGAGIERTGKAMRDALSEIEHWPAATGDVTRPGFEQRQMAVMASLMLRAALARTESRGGHYRGDFPETDDAHWKRQQVFVRDH